MENDLEPAVLARFPEVGRARAALERAGALKAMMSGSGSTVYGVFAEEPAAARAARELAALPGDWRVFSARLAAD